MKIEHTMLNLNEFNARTKNKWNGEPLEFFKCKMCGFIVLGIPDCHLALMDPIHLNKTIKYNLPSIIDCPHCKETWYEPGQINSYQVEDVDTDELKTTGWRWILLERKEHKPI
ncbi:MAG: hypothetical protein PHV17_04355 [Candidatus Omnitrophica bacterium]|nr:hypothetical protein [Candidatus Omnitrophota bacterium]